MKVSVYQSEFISSLYSIIRVFRRKMWTWNYWICSWRFTATCSSWILGVLWAGRSVHWHWMTSSVVNLPTTCPRRQVFVVRACLGLRSVPRPRHKDLYVKSPEDYTKDNPDGQVWVSFDSVIQVAEGVDEELWVDAIQWLVCVAWLIDWLIGILYYVKARQQMMVALTRMSCSRATADYGPIKRAIHGRLDR